MSERKKISVKKVLHFTAGALFVIAFTIALIAASRQQNNKVIKGLDIHLNDENDFSFLQRKDIEKMLLTNRNINLLQTAIARLDLKQMEAVAKTNPWVAKADVFVDNRQILQVNITQREPIARIFSTDGSSYYMDSLLNKMPVSTGYSFPAPVFTNVPAFKNDSLDKIVKSRIAYISHVIGKDSFWHAQITQIEVQQDQNFVLIPLLGNQRILLGDTSNITQKLGNLFAFYRNISNKIGWDKYETLDIRFASQVVASPSIGWTPPKAAEIELAESPSPSAITATAIKNTPSTLISVDDKLEKAPKPTVEKTKVKAKEIMPKSARTGQPVAAANKEKKEGQTGKENSKNKKTKSPKYIYTGKNSGNH